ncbi:hypothetical protein ACWD0A_31655 [Streptomyces sp. NPDC002867]
MRVVLQDGGATESPWGLLHARWHGTVPPGLHDVEIDVPDAVTSWCPAEGPDLLENMQPNGPFRLRGSIEYLAEDERVAGLRLGGDVVLLEFTDEARLPRPGDRIEFVTPSIVLYPYEL